MEENEQHSGEDSMRWLIYSVLVSASLALLVPAHLYMEAQTAAPAAETLVAPSMAAVTRHAEKLEVPRKGKSSLHVQAELSSWISINRAREITVPPQGLYLATLTNGTALTTINGEEKLRKAGETWLVPQGQAMTVKIQEKRQETVGLEVFSLKVTP
jgi:hypothetical protein